jgi:hypothetical protein
MITGLFLVLLALVGIIAIMVCSCRSLRFSSISVLLHSLQELCGARSLRFSPLSVSSPSFYRLCGGPETSDAITPPPPPRMLARRWAILTRVTREARSIRQNIGRSAP